MKLITANKLNKFWKIGVLVALGKKIDAAKVLTTVEQVEANTDEANVAGALALKEVNNSLGGLSFAQDAEGNWGYKPSGADTVIPFKSGEIIDLGTGTSWDISKYYSGYDKLTSDNFIVEVSSLKSGHGWDSSRV